MRILLSPPDSQSPEPSASAVKLRVPFGELKASAERSIAADSSFSISAISGVKTTCVTAVAADE